MTEEGETSEIYFFGLDMFLKCCEAKKRKTRCYITLLVLLCLSSVCAAKKKGKRAAILILQQRSLTQPLFLRGEEILQNCNLDSTSSLTTGTLNKGEDGEAEAHHSCQDLCCSSNRYISRARVKEKQEEQEKERTQNGILF